MTNFHVAVSGKAVVCCPHDRTKREITTEAQVAELGLSVGQIYDSRQHRLWTCSCCQNLFVDPTDEPRYCRTCQRRPTHQVNGQLPPPNGRPH
jgi:hypothetical protein